MEESSSRSKESEGKKVEGITISDNVIEEIKVNSKEEEDKTVEWNKFKKVEMPMFNGIDPDSWLFRIDQ